MHFESVYGGSANDRNWWDNPGAARIGYAPQDNAEDHAEAILATMAPNDEPENERPFHGGAFCGMEVTADLDEID